MVNTQGYIIFEVSGDGYTECLKSLDTLRVCRRKKRRWDFETYAVATLEYSEQVACEQSNSLSDMFTLYKVEMPNIDSFPCR